MKQGFLFYKSGVTPEKAITNSRNRKCKIAISKKEVQGVIYGVIR